MSYADRARAAHKRAATDQGHTPAVAFEAAALCAIGLAVEADQEIARLREIERHARDVMTLLEDGGPDRWGAHLIDSDSNSGQRLRDALGGFD